MVSVIYGPNGGGKTNLISALSCLISTIVKPIHELGSTRQSLIMQQKIAAEPFLFDAVSKEEPTEFQIFFRLYLPLSGPVLATIALWIGIGHWNSFFDSMVYTSSENLQTLQLFLVKLIKEAAMAQGEAASRVPAQVVRTTSITTIRYAAITISTVPIFVVYPFIQKYLSKGVIIGAVKG